MLDAKDVTFHREGTVKNLLEILETEKISFGKRTVSKYCKDDMQVT